MEKNVNGRKKNEGTKRSWPQCFTARDFNK